MPNIETIKTFSDPQKAFMKSKARFKMWRASRRQGKTYSAEYEHSKYALYNPNTVNWYVAQDLALCTELNVPLFRDILPAELIKEYAKSERKYVVCNLGPDNKLLYNSGVPSHSYFYFKTANSSDSLRGRKVHKLTCEEPTYWQNGADIYHNILRPQLADTLGSCSIIFTPPTKKAPKGAEWVRRLELMWAEEIKRGNPDYAIFHNTIWDSPYITEQEKKDLEKMTDPETWQCEYMAEYNDRQGAVYWEYDPLEKKYVIPADTPVLMRVRGIDWGLDDNTGCSWINLLANNKIYISDEHVENNLDVPEQAERIKRKTTVAPLWSVLDSSCWNRLPGAECVAKRFAAAGIPVLQGTKDLDGSISDMKVMFSEGNIIIDPKCVKTLQAINDWQWGQHEPDILAAMRYGVNALIRGGKLMPPVRRTVKTFQNHIQELDELDRRSASLNKALADKSRGRYMQSFKIM